MTHLLGKGRIWNITIHPLGEEICLVDTFEYVSEPKGQDTKFKDVTGTETSPPGCNVHNAPPPAVNVLQHVSHKLVNIDALKEKGSRAKNLSAAPNFDNVDIGSEPKREEQSTF